IIQVYFNKVIGPNVDLVQDNYRTTMEQLKDSYGTTTGIF
ncbi:7789_t:CDS:2, partial [Gigaspora margarita]